MQIHSILQCLFAATIIKGVRSDWYYWIDRGCPDYVSGAMKEAVLMHARAAHRMTITPRDENQALAFNWLFKSEMTPGPNIPDFSDFANVKSKPCSYTLSQTRVPPHTDVGKVKNLQLSRDTRDLQQSCIRLNH